MTDYTFAWSYVKFNYFPHISHRNNHNPKVIMRLKYETWGELLYKKLKSKKNCCSKFWHATKWKLANLFLISSIPQSTTVKSFHVKLLFAFSCNFLIISYIYVINQWKKNFFILKRANCTRNILIIHLANTGIKE